MDRHAIRLGVNIDHVATVRQARRGLEPDPVQAAVLALLLIVGFVTSSLWVPGATLAGVGYVINKIADLLIGFVLFKVLGYEARRYRETAPDLPPTLRL